MKVYVVFHSDLEDDRYVRAVCASREVAQRIADSPEQFPNLGYTRDHFTRNGTQPSLCCVVDEWTVVPRGTWDTNDIVEPAKVPNID